MKKKNLILFPLFFYITLLSSCIFGKKIGKSKEETIEVNAAFKKVYNATQQALLEANNNDLTLESIDLSFQTTTTVEGEVGIKLWVLSGKYSRSKSSSKKATFSFGEDKNTPKALTTDPKIEQFKKYLVSVINASQTIEKIGTFGLTELEVEVEFTIKKSGGAEVEIEIIPVTASINREKEVVHTITLKFKKKK